MLSTDPRGCAFHQEAGEAEQIHVEPQVCSRTSGSWEEHLSLSQVPLEYHLVHANLGVQLQGRMEKLQEQHHVECPELEGLKPSFWPCTGHPQYCK